VLLPDASTLSLQDLASVQRFLDFWSLVLITESEHNDKKLTDTIKIINRLDYNSLKAHSLDYD